MQGNDRAKALLGLLTAVLAVLAAFGVIDFAEPGTDGNTVTVADPMPVVPEATVVDGADANAKFDDVIPLDSKARKVTASLIENPRDLEPEGLRGDADRGPVAKLKPPYAAEEIPGCRTAFLTTNWSYRFTGSRVLWIVWHYTAGADLPGTRSEVTGLTAFGNNPVSRVSWNLNIDKDGNCDYNVPLRYKSWAFGNGNSYAVNIEVAGRGEPPYLRAGGIAQAKRIVKYVHDAYPAVTVRQGTISNCGPGTPGMLTHWQGGACSGGHTDIKPLDFAAFLRQLAACDATCKQRNVVAGRKRKHTATHAAMAAAGCKGRIHSRPPSAYHDACLKLKRRDVRQRAGVKRAVRNLRS